MDEETRGMNRVLLVQKGNSYLATSLLSNLKEGGSETFSCQANVNEIASAKEYAYNAMILYGSPDFVEDAKVLTYLADNIEENDTPYYVIADSTELEVFKKMLPANCRRMEFLRPVKVDEVAFKINYDLLQNVGVTHRKKILVVDDSGTMLRKIKGWLDDRYKITLANSGARAMKALALEIPDLVLLDYEMPIVDGRQVLGMMRDEPEYANIPVIFLTGKSDAESVKSVLDLKPEGYLLKTESPDKIIGQIDAFFAKQG